MTFAPLCISKLVKTNVIKVLSPAIVLFSSKLLGNSEEIEQHVITIQEILYKVLKRQSFVLKGSQVQILGGTTGF